MVYNKGDKVRFLNENGGGEVVEIKGEELLILTEDGFEDWYPSHALIPERRMDIGKVPVKDSRAVPSSSTAPRQEPGVVEVDLHFDAMVEFPKNYSARDRLHMQLDEAERAIGRARRAGIKKLILIHGVGEGVLKEALHTMLERQDRLDFYDASYARYGRGATEVELR